MEDKHLKKDLQNNLFEEDSYFKSKKYIMIQWIDNILTQAPSIVDDLEDFIPEYVDPLL